MSEAKPLGHRAYGSIGHIEGSRLGPADHMVHEGQAEIVTEGRKGWDVFVQTKLDGSCVSAANINGEIVALGRAGYLATTSKYQMHHFWADWVKENELRFLGVLEPGERLVGEWLAQAHGTKYDLTDREPFVAFDLMTKHKRTPTLEFLNRAGLDFQTPDTLKGAYGPLLAIEMLDHYGAESPEGVVYRAEQNGKVQFLAKYVRQEKVDGIYLDDEVWNWQP